MKRFILFTLVFSALSGCADMPFHDEDLGAPGRSLSGDTHVPMRANGAAHAAYR